MPSVEAYVGYIEVDVDLDDYDTDDLIEELRKRGRNDFVCSDANSALREIYELRRTGRDYQRELDALIYDVLGRVS